jgi:hypothetical protein
MSGCHERRGQLAWDAFSPVVFGVSFFGLIYLLERLEVTASWCWPVVHPRIADRDRGHDRRVFGAHADAATERPGSASGRQGSGGGSRGSSSGAVRQDDVGLSARVTMGLPTNAFDVTLEIAQSADRSFELLSRVIGRLGRVLGEDRTDEGARLQGSSAPAPSR